MIKNKIINVVININITRFAKYRVKVHRFVFNIYYESIFKLSYISN